MGKGDGSPSCNYSPCQFDPHANAACAMVCKAFGSCIGPCNAPCYILSAQFPVCRPGNADDIPVH